MTTTKTTAIYVDDGCEQDWTGDDVHQWYVVPGDEDGEPTGKTVAYGSFGAAVAAAERLAAQYGGVEVVTV